MSIRTSFTDIGFLDKFPQRNDNLLWKNLRQGDRDAFEEIYLGHVDDLYTYGIHIFKDKVIVEDATHDVFVALWRRREFLGETTSIKFYLRKALKRNIVRKLKTKERLSATYTLPEKEALGREESSEVQMINQQALEEKSETLLQAIRSLPDRQREIIVYKFYDNLSSQEISSAMSISLDSVYTQMSRAVRELRKRIRFRI